MDIITLEGITKEYALGSNMVRVLNGVQMNIKKGDLVAITGPSGSGKSTLLNILGCLDVPTDGNYLLDGDLVSDKTEGELSDVRSRKIGFIFQNFHLIPELTALQNVLLPQFYVDEEQEDTAIELLARVGLADRIHHKPAELSGGQRQRVAIARSLINEPAMILADEPTGNLDSKTGDDILDLLRELHDEGRTIVIVTHDSKIEKMVERVIHLQDGTVV